MRLSVLRLALKRRIEIRGRCLRLMEIVQKVSAIDIRGDHTRIAIQRLGKILPRQFTFSFVLVHIAGKQRNIRLLWQDAFVLRCQREQIVISLEVQVVVSEIDGSVSVTGESLDRLLTDACGFPIVAIEAEVSLLLAQYLRLGL